jgi:hypothetical protein
LERSSSPVKEIHESGKIDPCLRDEIHPGERYLHQIIANESLCISASILHRQ